MLDRVTKYLESDFNYFEATSFVKTYFIWVLRALLRVN